METQQIINQADVGHAPNGSSAAPAPEPLPGPTALQTVRDNFKGLPDKKTLDAHKAKFEATKKALDTAQAVAEKAQREFQAASAALIMATGGREIRVAGMVYSPACRGEVLFYRTRTERETLDL